MASINTNASAMTALQALNMTNKTMEKTQAAIATGFRVGEAKDNAAYWSIATAMRSDNKALSTVKDALGLGAATIDIAYVGVKASIKVIDEIKMKLVAARNPGVDRDKVQTEITALQLQLAAISDAAAFSGENWLAVDSDDVGYNDIKSIVSSFTRKGDLVDVATIDISIAGTKLYDEGAGFGIIDQLRTIGTTVSINVSSLDIALLTNNDADLLILEDYIQAVQDVSDEMTDAATNLGAVASRVGMQQDFVDQLMDAVTRGVGQLVDAEMNSESTKLQALQVQQQLGIQALSIANGNSQNILALFQ